MPTKTKHEEKNKEQLSFEEREELERKKAQAVDLSSRLFKLLKAKQRRVFTGMKEHTEEFKPNKVLSIEVTEGQKLSFEITNDQTHFRFDATQKESLDKFKLFYDEFLTAFKAEYPESDCVLELKAYSKESLDETLRALESKGIKVDAILLVDGKGNRIIDLSKKEDVDAYYEKLNKPEDDSDLAASASSAAAASGKHSDSSSSKRPTLG